MASYHYFGNERERIPRETSELVVHPLVREIPDAACHKFERLTLVSFNGSALKTVGKYAFYECVSLLEIAIPRSVTTIERDAFSYCRSLRQVHFDEDGVLAAIGESAFAYCRALAEVSIPSSVETIRYGAFNDCKCVTRVSFQEGLKVMEERAFANCVTLQNVDIPRTLEIIGKAAFYKCTSLEQVNMGEGNLMAIGEQAFLGCVKLQTISIPSTVERIKSLAFQDCASLGILNFQIGLKYVDTHAFASCKNLQSVALPESVEIIGALAFGRCRKLVSVELRDGPRDLRIHGKAFEGCKSFVNICLPSDSREFGRTKPSQHFIGCTALRSQYDNDSILLSLKHRFDNFPIHKRCYHASVTTTDELAQAIESSMQSSQKGNTTHDQLVDPFGMTPFHVLLSAANPRLDLLQVLLDAYPPYILGWKDLNGKTAVEYLTQRSYHLSENSRDMLRMTLHRWLVGAISSWNGLEAWKLGISSRINAIMAEDVLEERRSLLREALMALSRYEKIEAITLLELSLWKMEMKASDCAPIETAVDKEDGREAYRIRSGASVVIPNMIAYFYESNSCSSDGGSQSSSDDNDY
ncbi:unnamed protein product [Cylindrotheca closterium]|uniref:Uncharacterized protein n=1 Tax=Cylindrotheca closterium TaxID=2856 RepID=A0AAD2CM58_9STRA|nr:unnamed protein product [Cylindrotheca closterium]